MSKEVDDLGELQDILASEDEEEVISTENEEEVSPPSGEEEGKEREENLEEINLGEQVKEGEGGEVTLPQFKEITKKYPNFFKDFPNLRHAFFREKEYSEIFSTVDEAKEAQEDIEGLR